jgi:uncharacterized membrane protein
MKISELKSLTRDQLKGRWWEAISFHLAYFAIIIIITFGIGFAVAFSPDPYYDYIALVFNIVGFIISPVLAVGFCCFYLNFIKHENKISDMMLGFRKFVKSFVAYFLTTIAFSVGLILLIIPGIITGLMFSQVFYIVAENDNMSAIEAMKESARIMKGNKLKYIMLNLSFIGWSLLGAITFGIGLIWIIPYYNITLANFYKDISRI